MKVKSTLLISLISITFLYAQPPKAPSNLKIINVTEHSIALRWQDNSNNEKGFKVYRETKERIFKEIKTLPPNTTFYRDEGLKSFTSYKYRVKAFNDEGESPFSNTAKATTLKENPKYIFKPIAGLEITQNNPYMVVQNIYSKVKINIQLKWNTKADLDLHVMLPNGEEVYYSHNRSNDGKIWLNNDCICQNECEENILSITPISTGTYTIKVVLYSLCNNENIPYTLNINGTIYNGILNNDNQYDIFYKKL